VSLGRLRSGELVALAGAVGLLVLLFFDWFGADFSGWAAYAPKGEHVMVATQSGWSSLGWFMDLLLCVLIFGGLSITYMTLMRSTPAWPVGASVMTAIVGALIWIVLALRVLTLGDNGLGPVSVTVELPAYLGLLFAALIPAGAWRALADERTDAPESAYTPPPARPVPGPTTT
jgi:hypothetical protein